MGAHASLQPVVLSLLCACLLGFLKAHDEASGRDKAESKSAKRSSKQSASAASAASAVARWQMNASELEDAADNAFFACSVIEQILVAVRGTASSSASTTAGTAGTQGDSGASTTLDIGSGEIVRAHLRRFSLITCSGLPWWRDLWESVVAASQSPSVLSRVPLVCHYVWRVAAIDADRAQASGSSAAASSAPSASSQAILKLLGAQPRAEAQAAQKPAAQQPQQQPQRKSKKRS